MSHSNQPDRSVLVFSFIAVLAFLAGFGLGYAMALYDASAHVNQRLDTLKKIMEEKQSGDKE